MKLKQRLVAGLLALAMMIQILGGAVVNAAPAEVVPLSLPPFDGDSADAYRSGFTYYDQIPTMLMGEPTEGRVLMEKGSDTPRAIASLTKLMTYYIVKSEIESGALDPQQMITVSASAAALNVPGNSSYGLVAGEQLSLEQLIFGMMVVSGNDAADQIAQVVSGSEAAFAERMNQTAKELGMTNTTFFNAHGLTENGQYNTASARDLFRLIAEILKRFPEVREFVKTKTVNEPERHFQGTSTLAKTSVDLPGMTGLKTGTTEEAGYCFAGTFELTSSIDSTPFEVVTVVLGADSDDARWRTTKELIDLAAGSFQFHAIVDAAKPVGRYEMPTSDEGSVVLYPSESYSTFTFGESKYDVHTDLMENVKAPTDKEQKFGELSVYQDGQLIKVIDVVAHDATVRASLPTRAMRAVQGFFRFVAGLL